MEESKQEKPVEPAAKPEVVVQPPAPEAPKKKQFKMPHLLWMMVGVILLGCLLTYIIPAGAFELDEKKNAIPGTFHLLDKQSPQSPWNALMYIMDGLRNASNIIFIIMVAGGTIRVFLESNAVDDFLNWATFKLKDKGVVVLVTILYWLMVYLGGFGGNDGMVAMVPIGILLAKKLKLDPVVAVGVTTYACLVGFGAGPTKQVATQGLFDVPIYSGFITRFIFMNIFGIFGYVYLMHYVNKIRKDPTKSIMYAEGWRPVFSDEEIKAQEAALIKPTTLNWRTALIMLLFFGQYIVIVWYNLSGQGGSVYPIMAAVYFFTAIAVGLLAKMNGQKLATTYARGIQGNGFIGFIIGLAGVFSLVLSNGNILSTIVNTLTTPLMSVNRGWAAVGITIVIAIMDPLIPSANAKAAMLVPVLKPVIDLLGFSRQIGVMAFQYGDAWTNLVSPVLAWMIGSLAAADIPYQKWLKWVLPFVLFMIVVSFAVVYFITLSGYDAMM